LYFAQILRNFVANLAINIHANPAELLVANLAIKEFVQILRNKVANLAFSVILNTW